MSAPKLSVSSFQDNERYWSVQGAICVDTLSTGWSPVLTVKSALMMLQSLLASPEPKDPQDAEVASMMLKKPEEFKHKAREWAIIYAGAPRPDMGESSGGATEKSIRKHLAAQQKLVAPKIDNAQYVPSTSLNGSSASSLERSGSWQVTDQFLDTRVTVKSWLVDLQKWDSRFRKS